MILYKENKVVLLDKNRYYYNYSQLFYKNLPIAYIRDNTILYNNRYMNNLINKITSLKHLYNYTETKKYVRETI